MVWYAIIYFVVALIIGELLRPKPRFDTPQPSSLGDFQVPTAEEGRAIPAIFGTVNVKGPNVTWYGDLKVVPITEKVKTGLFSSKRITKGYKYYLGIQLALCHGVVDEVLEFTWGDRKSTPVTSFTSADFNTYDFDDMDLFGGEDREGGIKGKMDVYFGTTTQTANSYLNAATGVTNPGYRTICYAVMRQMYIGNSQYIKQNAFVLRRCPNQLGLTGGKHNMNGDANPACALYDILTNTQWGCGFDPSQIDIASFTSMGNTCFDEGLGVSFQLQSSSSADEVCRDLLRHVDGVLYSDPQTGLLTVKLARHDYVVASLDVLDDTNCEEMEFTRGSWEETINTIRVLITDRSQGFTDRPVPAQNLANIQARGGWVEPEDYPFKMISNVTTGMKVASRVLKTVSSPLARGQTTVNRLAYKYRPGTVVKVTWPKYGIAELVMRITNIDYGEYKEGKIRVDLVEDIFHTAYNAFEPPAATGWVKPTTTPGANTLAKFMEVPYFVFANSAPPATDVSNPSYAFIMIQRPVSQNHSFNVYDSVDNVTANYNLIGTDLYTPTAQANGALAWNTTTFNLDSFLGDTDELTVNMPTSLMLVDDEWMLVTALDFGTGAATVKRGVLDTIPVVHADNARAWLYFGANGFSDFEHARAKGTTRWYRETGLSIDGESDLATALTQSHVHDQDYMRPYPPADVKIEGTYYPTEVPGNFTITWKGRNRLTQTAPKAWTDPHEAPEAGTSYTLRVYDNDTSTLLKEVVGLGVTATGGTYTYPGQSTVVTNYRIELWAVRSGLASRQKFTHTAAVFGYGLLYDFRYGGSIAGIVLPRGTSSVATGEQYRRVPTPTWVNGNWHDLEYRHPGLSVDGGQTWVVEALAPDAFNDPPSQIFGANVDYIYGLGIYVATNRSGTYWVRRDGGYWRQYSPASTSLNGAGNISVITFDGTRFLASMGNNSVYTTTDPTSPMSWTLLSSMPAGYTLLGALKTSTQYVAHASKDGSLWAFTSPDAVTWTLVVTPLETGVSRIFWLFYAGFYFNGAYFVFNSDGPTWETRTLYGLRSADMITWTTITLPSAGSGSTWGGCWIANSQLWVQGGDYIWESSDGSTFSRVGVSRLAFNSYQSTQSRFHLRGKGDRFSTENGPATALLYVPYYVEDGGKLVAVTDLPTAGGYALKYPLDGTVTNAAKFGALTPIISNGGVTEPAYNNSGFRVSLRQIDGYGGKSMVARMTGKKYFEVTVEELPYGATDPITTLQVGVGWSFFPNADVVGSDPTHGCLIYANGFEYIPVIGDVIGVLMDLDVGTCEIRVNNVTFKTRTSMVTGFSYVPVYNSPRATVNANLGQNGFVYSVGGGYGAWDA